MAEYIQPIQMVWQGDAFTPANSYWQDRADKLFTVGQRYAIVEHHERSDASHSHYFAVLHELWLSLPEKISHEFPNAAVLRAHALIKTGYCDKRSIVCKSAKEAERLAAFMRPSNALAIITVEGSTVTEWTPQSQAYRAMGKKVFGESKNAVLGWCADLIGLPPDAEQRTDQTPSEEER